MAAAGASGSGLGSVTMTITKALCGEMDPFVVGDVCIFTGETDEGKKIALVNREMFDSGIEADHMARFGNKKITVMGLYNVTDQELEVLRDVTGTAYFYQKWPGEFADANGGGNGGGGGNDWTTNCNIYTGDDWGDPRNLGEKKDYFRPEPGDRKLHYRVTERTYKPTGKKYYEYRTFRDEDDGGNTIGWVQSHYDDGNKLVATIGDGDYYNCKNIR